ncbi:MAG TPA: CHAD domain-containing protein [Thermoleophilaceae bacterium]
MNGRNVRVAAALIVVLWAIVQIEGRRPRRAEQDDGTLEGVEIERKFLVYELPDLSDHPGEEIEQGYLALDGEVELRVRRAGTSTLITMKAGGGESRFEEEFEIDPARFKELWKFTAGRRLRKTRHRIDAGDGLLYELDVYAGWLTGLAVVEVEFPTLEASAGFEPPDWFGPEVTGEPQYKNQALAQLESNARAERVFKLHMREPVADGIRRIARGQIEEVLDRLEGRTDEGFGTAVHESRKSLKRLRAIVRLVRDEVGDDVYRRENACFRDVGRALSGPRDAHILIEALDSLTERYSDETADLTAFRAQLERAYEALQAELTEGSPLLAELAAELRAAEDRVADWRLRDRGFRLVSPGLDRAYRRGRRAYRAALDDPSPEHLHEWRKRVKDLWYSLQILEEAGPRRIKKLASEAHDLSDLLGEDHDFVVLEQRSAGPGADLSEGSLAALRGMSERRRGELQAQAFHMAPGLYRKAPAAFVDRVRRGWRKHGGAK